MIWAARVAYPTAETMQMLQNLRNSNESGAPTHPQTPIPIFEGPPEPPSKSIEMRRKSKKSHRKLYEITKIV